MTGRSCPECGAPYPNDAVTCEARFHAPLALDHSRQEPGQPPRQAFAAFALNTQVPSRHLSMRVVGIVSDLLFR
jgi:hypothetical protein